MDILLLFLCIIKRWSSMVDIDRPKYDLTKNPVTSSNLRSVPYERTVYCTWLQAGWYQLVIKKYEATPSNIIIIYYLFKTAKLVFFFFLVSFLPLLCRPYFPPD